MKRPIPFAPLLMILMLSGVVECISEGVSLYPSATLPPERSPDITGDNQLLRLSTLRVPTQKAQPHHEPLLPQFALLSSGSAVLIYVLVSLFIFLESSFLPASRCRIPLTIPA